MKNQEMHLQLPKGYTFDVEFKLCAPGEKYDTAVFQLKDETGAALCEMEIPDYHARGSWAPWVKKMFLEEYYKHPDVYWSENRSKRTLSYLRLVHDRLSEERLSAKLERTDYSFRSPFVYTIDGTILTGYISRRRRSHQLVTATYSFLVGEPRSQSVATDTGFVVETANRLELKFVELCTPETGIPTGEEVYAKYNPIIDAAYRACKNY